jgi:cytochrome b561
LRAKRPAGSHMVLAYLLAAVVLIHLIGALRHHIIKRNDVLRRMTWMGALRKANVPVVPA